MNSGPVWRFWQNDDLRMRYRPRSRIGQVFLTVVPWIDAVLIALTLMMTSRLFLLQPGVMFDLPRAPFREGIDRGLRAVLLWVDRADGAEAIVFFDDERYRAVLDADREALRNRISAQVSQRGERTLLLYADRNVPHGEVIRLVNLVREAGVTRVNVSLKAE